MTALKEHKPADSNVIRSFLEESFAPANERKLPPRVRKQLNRRRASSEVLIKVIQLGVLVIWAVLYFLAPRTDYGTAFSPVPYALTGYLILNLIGLFWAIRRRLPDWAIYINVLIDMGMLMVLIWSFHIQYGQPAAFYLKAPTMLYIFIFIALRALRFEPRFVVAMGVAAAAGWLVLTAYGVFASPNENTITRDYVEYLTSNSILLGAEFDKVIVILMVTFILALALKRAQSSLIRAVTEGTAARDLSKFFDAGVAEQIRDAQVELVPGQGIRRNAAILFVDIRDFTKSTADLPPDEVVSILTEYERRIVPIIHRHGGVIDKFLGDGIMASFGAVAETSSYAADVLRAIDDIIEETDRWERADGVLRQIAGPRVNAAAASGPVIFGSLGDDKRLEFTTIGATVNLAAKLEKFNKPASTRALCDRRTYDLALIQGYAARPVKTGRYRLEGVSSELEVTTLH